MAPKTLREALFHTEKGKGRTRVCLTAWGMGQDFLVLIYNRNAHLGAVSVSEFDVRVGRNSVSTITLLGHKDDALSREAAYSIGKATKKNISVVAGVHIDNITPEEISRALDNARVGVAEFITSL